jgi:hypothetical protein
MPRARKTEDIKERKADGFVPKPHHDRILEAIYRYHFMTVEQVTRLLYSRGTISTVRALLNELAVNKYLLSFHEPRPTPVGSTPKIYTLSLQGFNHLKKQGASVPTRFREPDVEELEKNYLFLKHNLAVTDFLIAAKVLEKQMPTIQLYGFLHERALKQQPPLTATIEKRTPDGEQMIDTDGKVALSTIRLYLDGFLDFRLRLPDREKPARFCLLLELDRKTESEADIKRKIRGLLIAVKSGECFKRFGTRNPTVAFVNAVGGEARREQLRAWAEAELKKTKEPKYWTEMFVFTDMPGDGIIDCQQLFLSPVWYMPFSDKPSVLIRVGHDKQYEVKG